MTRRLADEEALNSWEWILDGRWSDQRMPRLTVRRARTLLAQVAAARPDHCHPYREYSAAGGPGCLIGHVLYAARASLEALGAADVAGPGGGSLPVPALVRERYFSRIEPDAARLLDVAQRWTDTGATWGQAAAAALVTTKAVAS